MTIFKVSTSQEAEQRKRELEQAGYRDVLIGKFSGKFLTIKGLYQEESYSVSALPPEDKTKGFCRKK